MFWSPPAPAMATAMCREPLEKVAGELPAVVDTDDISIAMLDRPAAVRIVGDLYSLRFPFEWAAGRRRGPAYVDLTRCASTLTEVRVTLTGRSDPQLAARLADAVAAGRKGDARRAPALVAATSHPRQAQVVPLFP